MSQPPDPNWSEPGGPVSQPPEMTPPDNDPVGAPGGWGGPPPGGWGPPGGSGGGYGPFGPAGAGGQLLVTGPAPVLVSFAPRARQSRLTVFFRAILLVPHLIILYALNIATSVVVVIGWFAALFTGSLPDWAHTFITGFLRWQFRVYAYLHLLTGAYPPFSLEDDTYPVRLVTARARLNRLAVFFRLILIIPAGLVAAAAGFGLGLLSFVGWLIALVAGQLPESVHLALASLVRYQSRFLGYYYLATGEYPKGLLGDSAAPLTAAAAAAPASLGPSTAGSEGDSATAVLAPEQEPPAVADPWQLILTSGAKKLVWVFLVVGFLGYIGAVVGGFIAASSNAGTVSNLAAFNVTNQAYLSLGTSMSQYPAKVNACGSSLSCVTALDRNLATAIQGFGSSVQSAGFTGAAATDASAVTSDANATARSLNQLGATTSPAQYQSVANSSQLQQQLTQLVNDYQKLASDVGLH